MIIVPVKEGENIERAIKKFKRKFDKTGGSELRWRMRSMCSRCTLTTICNRSDYSWFGFFRIGKKGKWSRFGGFISF